MDVFLQFLLLVGIGVCVWLAFHPSSREDYDDIETSRRLAQPATDIHSRPIDLDFLATLPRRPVGDWRLPTQARPVHDEIVATTSAEEDSARPSHWA